MNDRQLSVARRNLTSFVIEQADATACRLGFDWRESELAPGSFGELQREHRCSELSGLPLRVSARFCDRTIYNSPGGNQAMRFWHDTAHVRLGLTFTPDDEMELGCHHLEVLRAQGFAADSIEHHLLHADTIGQTLCKVTIGQFPIDQRRFAESATRLGVAGAIEDVARRELSTAASIATSPDGEAA